MAEGNSLGGVLPSLSLEKCHDIWLGLSPDERAEIMERIDEKKKKNIDQYLHACLEYIIAHPASPLLKYKQRFNL